MSCIVPQLVANMPVTFVTYQSRWSSTNRRTLFLYLSHALRLFPFFPSCLSLISHTRETHIRKCTLRGVRAEKSHVTVSKLRSATDYGNTGRIY